MSIHRESQLAVEALVAVGPSARTAAAGLTCTVGVVLVGLRAMIAR